jgi:GT2 family glycosyltransferase
VTSILEKTTYENYEIIIVDNNSRELKTFAYFDNLKLNRRVRIMRDTRPFNYSALNNAAVQATDAEVIGLINNDIEVITPEWLTEMVSHAMRPSVGAVGARLWYPTKLLQHGGVVMALGGLAGHAHPNLPFGHPGYVGRAALAQNFSAVTAACLVIRRDRYLQVGGLNEIELTVAYNDVDLCLKLVDAGYRNVWTPFADLYHHESATRGYEVTPEKMQRFAKEQEFMRTTWPRYMQYDPAYNPNLSLDQGDFSLAPIPRVQKPWKG